MAQGTALPTNALSVANAVDGKLSTLTQVPRTKRYAGITNDLQRRFAEHKVDPRFIPCVYLQCESADVARQAEQLLLNSGYKGGGGGGNDSDKPDWIYAYEITAATVQ